MISAASTQISHAMPNYVDSTHDLRRCRHPIERLRRPSAKWNSSGATIAQVSRGSRISCLAVREKARWERAIFFRPSRAVPLGTFRESRGA